MDREEIGSSDRLLPQANAMRRAWDEMGPRRDFMLWMRPDGLLQGTFASKSTDRQELSACSGIRV